MFALEKYTPDQKDKWDDFISGSKNGLFFFKRDFLEYHADRFSDHSLVFFKDKKVAAVFPATENEKVVTSHGGLTFGSLIMGHDLKAKEVLDIFELLISYYKAQGFTEIIYKAIPYIFHKYIGDEDRYALFRNNAEHYRSDISSVIPIANRIRFSETKRQMVTKCLKNNVEVKEALDFGQYWDLLTEVLSKFDTKPVHTLEEIAKLKTIFPDNIRLFEARMNGDLLAGTVMFDFGNTVHTQYMAASQEGRKMGALDFINHYLLENVFNDKQYYSFGISTEEQGRKLNEGLIMQKENMGGRGVSLDFYSIKL